jgi:hypothetical protein
MEKKDYFLIMGLILLHYRVCRVPMVMAPKRDPTSGREDGQRDRFERAKEEGQRIGRPLSSRSSSSS